MFRTAPSIVSVEPVSVPSVQVRRAVALDRLLAEVVDVDRDRVGDEDAVLAQRGEAEDRRVHVHEVGDEARRQPVVVERGTRQARARGGRAGPCR